MTEDAPIVLGPEEGRIYPCGPMKAVFKADGAETGNRYSISEWWLDPHSDGPGAHRHEAGPGTMLRIPAGVTPDFANRTSKRAGLFNVFIPGGFEENMPAIVEWFRTHQ